MKQANRTLAAGLVIFLAGIGRDLQWHATHDTQGEFETASKRVEYAVRTFFFCSDSCRQQFEAEPERNAERTRVPNEVRVATHAH